MRLHRFIGDFDLTQDTLVVSNKEFLNQWKNVLRIKTGDSLILCDGKGIEAQATVQNMGKEWVLSIDTRENIIRGPKKETALYVSLLKRENFETVIQKATELGISKIVPLITERTVKTGFNRERLEKILKEASEQSRRTVLPILLDPIPFKEAVTSTTNAVIFDLTATQEGIGNATEFFIGPEGGFSENEITLAKEKGIHIASLGELTLRAETAAIVASYLGTR